ncbi:MAG TPA: hypothetical protein EYO84_08235 [Planctomycetes bacterium]|nr:hypothetical protein [Planctomycetota bacterium]
MQDHDLKPDPEDRLSALLEDAVEADRSLVNEVDSDLFLARLRGRISSSSRGLSSFQLAAAALVLLGVLSWALQDQFDHSAPNPDVIEDPGSSVLMMLDVLEVLAPLEPSVIALLDPSHFDTLEGFDSDIAALPLELLVTEEQEN